MKILNVERVYKYSYPLYLVTLSEEVPADIAGVCIAEVRENAIMLEVDNEMNAVVMLRSLLKDLEVSIIAEFVSTKWSGGDSFGNNMKAVDTILETREFIGSRGIEFLKFKEGVYDRKQELQAESSIRWF